MIDERLFEAALVEPLRRGANRLYVVSGYATGTMALSHSKVAKEERYGLSVNLIYGMTPQDGIELSNHHLLQEMDRGDYPIDFKCRYITERPAVHSKVYSWYRDDVPVMGFVGSANYTQNAFSSRQREVLLETDPEVCMNYYQSLLAESVSCNDADIDNIVNVYRRQEFEQIAKLSEGPSEATDNIRAGFLGLDSVTLSLLIKKNGEIIVPEISGLNWGQRESRRRKNESYIAVPAPVMRSGFFPAKNQHFTVITDDGKQMIVAIVSGVIGKQIQTPLNNSELGLYFRYRLGVGEQAKINKADLDHYGRTNVSFHKVDTDTYYMDFSPTNNTDIEIPEEDLNEF